VFMCMCICVLGGSTHALLLTSEHKMKVTNYVISRAK